MPAVTGPALVAAAVIALAGAQKLIDPAAAVGALRALNLPSSARLVRAGSAVELVLGVAAVSISGWIPWVLVAASYVAFGVFVVAALRKGTMIGSCGCFGREDTPPHWSHVVLNAVLAGVAVWAAVAAQPAALEAIADHGFEGVLVGLLAAGGTALLYAAYVLLPRTLAAGGMLPRPR